MPEPDMLVNPEDLRRSFVPPDNLWPPPSPLLDGRRASAGAVRDTISEEDAMLMSDADLMSVRADAIARWGQKADTAYLRRALEGVADELDRQFAWEAHQRRVARRQWAIVIGAWAIVGAAILVVLHWK